MNNIDRQYKELLEHILRFGVDKQDRTGTGTKSLFGWQIRHRMEEGFPLLTTKKMAWKSIVTELLWFLRGDTNIKFLVDNDCNIWNGDAYKRFTYYTDEETSMERFVELIKTDDEFAKKWGELGPIYGKQWRKWKTKEYPNNEPADYSYIDQIANLISELKTNPDSRRLMVNAWNVGELDQMTLPPCHYGFQVYTRELSSEERMELYETGNYTNGSVKLGGAQWEHKWMDTWAPNVPKRAISLMFNMRSTDVGLGLSFNLASYGLLLMMIAKQVNMVPDELIYNGGDVHLYANHIEPIKEQLTRQPYPLPTVKISDRKVNDISEYILEDIVLKNYQSHPSIKMPLSN